MRGRENQFSVWSRRRLVASLGVLGTTGCLRITDSGDSSADGTDGDGSAESDSGDSSGDANSLQVRNITGTASDGRIETVEFIVGLRNSGNINLNQVVITWTGSAGSYTITSESQNGGDGDFTVSSLTDDDNSISSDNTLNDSGDRATIAIDFTAFSDGIGEGDNVSVELTTESGGTTEAAIAVPQTLPEDGSVAL